MKLEWIEQYMKEAEQLIYANEVDRGICLLNELLYDEPGYGRLHNHLGWAYTYYTSDSARAELHLKMAIKFQSEFFAPYLHIGQLLIRIGRADEAIDYLRAGLTKPEANAVGLWDLIGRAYEMKADYRNAIAAYKQAMIGSLNDHEVKAFKEGINRCRKKRWVLFFSF